jgi:hypothetical protein
MGNDIFLDYINYLVFNDPTPKLVAGSSANPWLRMSFESFPSDFERTTG